METSNSMVWEWKLFTHDFIGFRPIEDMEIKLQINTSYMDLPTSSKSYNILHKIWYKTTSRLKPNP